ncbi:MAG: TolB-like 6-bladed beta-propeller domain-containing protein [Bacteroidales bacterium]|nr:TolB-like 6-bladed beta-propeller domain-containing protein [Bacteroidales bacterium]
MIKSKFIVLLSLVNLLSCTHNTSYFNGEIYSFEDFPETGLLTGENILLDSIFTGDMYVYDSIIGFSSSKYPDYYFSFFNLQNGNHLLNACKKGAGPNEFGQLSASQQFEHSNGDIKLWLYEDAKKRAHLLNITQSISKGETIIDSVIDLRWKSTGSFQPDSFIFMLEDDKVTTKNQSYKKDADVPGYIPPAYHVWNVVEKSAVQEITLYNRPLVSKDPTAAFFGDYLHSIDRIKPDKSKIAMGMQLLYQVNILDISSGELKGFRMKNTPDFKDLVKTSRSDLRGRYLNLCLDDDYIFAFYSGNKYEDYENYYLCNEVHVFDWEGNPVKRLLLDQKGNHLRLDAVNKKLYLKNYADEVFCYDVKELLYK